MSADINSRELIGTFYKTLEQDIGASWMPALSMLQQSDQGSETYNWLGQTPAMREWVGGRNAKGFDTSGITIANKHFEATLEILIKDLRRDKSGQVEVRIRELAQRANGHWASLLSTLIVAGTSTDCYDGQYFFDTDHEEGDSGAQSNDISVNISALPAAVHGVATAPSPEEMQQCIMQGIGAITGFVDNQGEPMNENAQKFLVMVPPSLYIPATNALTMPRGTGVSEQQSGKFNVEVVSNARLSSDWTDEFAVFRADGGVKPFIRQQETAVKMSAKAEGSEFAFDKSAHQYGIDAWRDVGYGFWHQACLVTMT